MNQGVAAGPSPAPRLGSTAVAAEASIARMKLESLIPMLQTPDLPNTIDFYTRVLGFCLANAWPDEREPKWCSLVRDGIELMFMDNEHEPREPALTGVLCVRVEGVLELHAAWKDRVEVRWGPEVFHYGMREFAIRDCNGYTLSFAEPTDDPPTELDE